MVRPPIVPDVLPNPDELRVIIQECVKDYDFGRETMNDLLLFFLEEGKPLFSGQTTYFILGSYDPYPIRRLRLVENQLNRRLLAYAFLLCDLLDPADLRQEPQPAPRSDDDVPWTHCKFHLLASYVEYIVSVFEGRHAGPSVELGELTGPDAYFEKTYVLQRRYESLSQEEIEADAAEIDVDNPYSQPQLDKFLLFERAGRLYTWEHQGDLAYQVSRLPH